MQCGICVFCVMFALHGIGFGSAALDLFSACLIVAVRSVLVRVRVCLFYMFIAVTPGLDSCLVRI